MSTSDASKQLQAVLDNANLHILNTRVQLKSYRFDGLEDLPAGEDALSDPAVVASDVAAQSVGISSVRASDFLTIGPLVVHPPTQISVSGAESQR